MFRALTILFLSVSSVIYSQKISFSNETDLYEILINVKLLDSESKSPISFAEVFFPNKNIGAISDENGDIFLNFLESKIVETDSLKIVSQGYKTISTTAKVFYQFLKNTLDLKDYMVKLKRECKLKREILLGLDKFITCPYYITNKEIYVFEEKLASELVLRAGDLDILIVSRR